MASNSIKSGFKRSALTVALGLCFAGSVHAQSTTGTIYGNAATGETITAVSETGFARTVGVDSAGRYNIGNLPVGNYTVTAKKGDQVVGTMQVLVKVSSGSEASFAGAAANPSNELGTITVTATGAGIDVTQVDSRTVITAKDLAVLPVAHSAEAIALLAPGTVKGSGFFGPAVSFGGAGVTENAYYINGYNVSDPLANIGGLSLPYGSIAQQETITGGYSAMYGRSDGGVISQIGKSGTNDWHFGGQVSLRPKSLASAPKDVYYPTIDVPAGYHVQYPAKMGTLYRDRSDDKTWNRTYDAYVGGPIVPGKLFFFLSGEVSKDSSVSTGSKEASPPIQTSSNESVPKIYAKINWNINDTNQFELTGIRVRDHISGNSSWYTYGQPATFQGAPAPNGAFLTPATEFKTNTLTYIAKYTNYLTDNLSFNVIYGKTSVNNPQIDTNTSPYAPIVNAFNQNPAYNGGSPIYSPQTETSGSTPYAHLGTHGIRFDVQYKIGSHQIAAGLDNMYYTARDQGAASPAAGYRWDYRYSPITGAYRARKYFFSTLASMSVDQKAFYVEDEWQVTDRFKLKGGLRSDDFNNKNNVGQSYVHQKHQLAPRLGAAWDLKGDSTMKLFANVGRYYLALPNEVAIRGASPSTFYYDNYKYTGIDANGAPTGLTLVSSHNSGNNEFGQPVDPNSIASKSLKPQYQDEAILGFDWQFSSKWTAGAKMTYRKLGTVIDDWCATGAVADALPGGGADYNVSGCYIINPGRANTFHVKNNVTGAYTDVTLTNAQIGFNSSNAEKPIRKYEALDLYLEHPFDGKWQWKMEYTWSRNPGNTEGQVRSDIGQTDVSKTEDWDYGGLMVNSYGYMANDRRHALRMRGMYQFAPEWLLTGKLLVQSGVPKNCLGYFYGDSDPIGYGSAYHTCFNQASPPGKEHGPWTKQLDLGIVYRPKYFQKKLTLAADVFNVANDRKPIQFSPTLETSSVSGGGDGTVLNSYGRGIFFQAPRYVQLSVSYDY